MPKRDAFRPTAEEEALLGLYNERVFKSTSDMVTVPGSQSANSSDPFIAEILGKLNRAGFGAGDADSLRRMYVRFIYDLTTKNLEDLKTMVESGAIPDHKMGSAAKSIMAGRYQDDVRGNALVKSVDASTSPSPITKDFMTWFFSPETQEIGRAHV